jgi:hypothetical protein
LRFGSTPSSASPNTPSPSFVGHVLPPQAVVGDERVLVAVGVRDALEPQLAGVDEVGDVLGGQAVDGVALGVERGARLPVVVDEEVERPPAGFPGQPLAGVLDRVVEHGRLGVVGLGVGVLGHLDGPDRAPEVRRAEALLLDERLGGDAVVLLLVLLLAVAGYGVVAGPDVPRGVAAGVVRRIRRLGDAGDALRRDAVGAERPRLLAGGVDLDVLPVVALGEVVATRGQPLLVLRGRLDPEGVERILPCLRGCGNGKRRRDRKRDANQASTHVPLR